MTNTTTAQPTIFTATVISTDVDDAATKVAKHLPEGWSLTGASHVRSERHMLHSVQVAGHGDVDDLWVRLTSYGISPSDDLGSHWQTLPGVGKAF